MASLDAARASAAAPGAFDEALSAAASAREAATAMPGLRVLSVGDGLPAVDPLKLTLHVSGLGITGELSAILQRRLFCMGSAY